MRFSLTTWRFALSAAVVMILRAINKHGGNLTVATAVVLLVATLCQGSASVRPAELAGPVESDGWITPAQGVTAEPVWGIKDGIAVGLWPTAGPRGLIRIYAPYLGHVPRRTINFIAVEPIVDNVRGFSEMEQCDLDNTRGKRMWTADTLQQDPQPASPWQPAAGKRVKIDGADALTFYLYTTPFKNGAQPIVQIILRKDRPYEVGLKVFAANDSKPMDACVLTATMGNYARLRQLWLADQVVDSTELWSNLAPDRFGFAPHRQWPVQRLLKVKDDIIVAVTPSEPDPTHAEYTKDTPRWWEYTGKVATQYWRKPSPDKTLVVGVNGRKSYWGHDQAIIPGGMSYENFELVAPFQPGQEFWFGVTLQTPQQLGFNPARQKTP